LEQTPLFEEPSPTGFPYERIPLFGKPELLRRGGAWGPCGDNGGRTTASWLPFECPMGPHTIKGNDPRYTIVYWLGDHWGRWNSGHGAVICVVMEAKLTAQQYLPPRPDTRPAKKVSKLWACPRCATPARAFFGGHHDRGQWVEGVCLDCWNDDHGTTYHGWPPTQE
jgi:hypothetical protein